MDRPLPARHLSVGFIQAGQQVAGSAESANILRDAGDAHPARGALHGNTLEHEQKELALFRLDELTMLGPLESRTRLPLAATLVHWNDDRLTREQIAEWLTQEPRG